MIREYFKWKFNELMTTDWVEMPAYKLGIISEQGKILRTRDTLQTEEEIRAYPSMFYTLCWNLRNLMEQGEKKSVIGPLVNTIFAMHQFCHEVGREDIDELVTEEVERRGLSSRFVCEEPEYKSIEPGDYIIRGRKVRIETPLFPCEEYFGHPVYRIDRMAFVLEDVKEDAPVNAVGHGNIAGVSPGQEPPGKRGLYFYRNKKKTKELKRRTGNL
jgi:hypothetical protein